MRYERREDAQCDDEPSDDRLPDSDGMMYAMWQWLDVRSMDTERWHEAQVIESHPRQICVSMRPPSAGLRVWFPIPSDRVQPLHTHTAWQPQTGPVRRLYVDASGAWPLTVSTHFAQVAIRVRERIDIQDPYWQWRTGTIVCVTEQQVRVRYDSDVPGEHSLDVEEEWIDCNSYRLAPLGIKVKSVHLNSTNSKPKRDELKTPSTYNERWFRAFVRMRLQAEICEMGGDGNCLFRAMSHQLYGCEDYHALIRDACVSYLEIEAPFFSNYVAGSFDVYVERMRRDGVWGDHVEIQALSELYECPIEIYAYTIDPIRTYDVHRHRTGVIPIRLSYHCSSHYNSIVPLRGREPLFRSPPGEFENNALSMSALRATSNATHIHLTSDVEATDQIQVASVLAASRQEFAAADQQVFEATVRTSIHELESQQAEEAKLISIEELDAQADEEDVQRVIALSLEDEYSRQLQSATLISGTLQQDLPRAVQLCHDNLQFPLRLCIDAYHSLPPELLPTMSNDQVIERMTEWIFTHLEYEFKQ